jgi:hypothetical protein
MIFDGVLAAPSNEDDVTDARVDGFFHAVLNDRLVDERQHLFWLRFGRWKKSGTETGGGKNRFADDVSHGGDRSRTPQTGIYNGGEVACSIPHLSEIS